MRDKKYPILFLIISIVSVFSIFLLASVHRTITGAAIGTTNQAYNFIWVGLILVVLFIGISVLHDKN